VVGFGFLHGGHLRGGVPRPGGTVSTSRSEIVKSLLRHVVDSRGGGLLAVRAREP
jgi:hypothetical protein